MAIAELKIAPFGTGSTSLSKYVAEVQRYLDGVSERLGLTYELNPMATVLEGELDSIFEAARGALERLYEAFPDEVKRVSLDLHIDDRRDKPASMQQKLRSVREKLD